MRKRLGIMMAVACFILGTVGCGGPKPTGSIFMMLNGSIPGEIEQKLQDELTIRADSVLQEGQTVKMNISPMFLLEKLIVELAAGDNNLIIVPKEQFQSLAAQGSMVVLDNDFDQKQYASGVYESVDVRDDVEYKETHLYALPMDNNSWLEQAGMNGKDVYMFIPVNADNIDFAKKMMKALME